MITACFTPLGATQLLYIFPQLKHSRAGITDWNHLRKRDKFLENNTFVMHSLEFSYLGFKLLFSTSYLLPLLYRWKGF